MSEKKPTLRFSPRDARKRPNWISPDAVDDAPVHDDGNEPRDLRLSAVRMPDISGGISIL